MRFRVFIPTMVLFLVFSGCAIHKGPSSGPVTPSAAKNFNYYLSQGNFFLKHKDFEKAIAQLKQALALNPNSSKAYNLLGIACFQQKDYNLAEKFFKKAVDINPSYAQAYNNLGGVYFMLQKFGMAEQMYEKALPLSPYPINTYYSLGTLLIILGKTEESTLYLSKGIELDPDFLERGGAYIINFSSSTFSSPEIYFTYARAFATTGNVEKTVEYLKKAKQAGFKDWQRIDKEKEFEKMRQDQRIRDYIKK
ncbi:MAG: tetratricopeptide repeat protein [Candidatus Aminicenantes bacterium]|nr:tetratricopeptide repeat protein [Candidatus Aminicenantes bacterium]MDH5383229.1 tetratricopeptide repeat protein [Candidatus Aminicenantes bacterium]MDH5706446.1 tetratricopeptide repeat protein [Candidatus Aminicenantes bacterium]